MGHHAPHAVDRARFDPDDAATLAAARALRDQLGLAPGTRVVLFAGKHVAAKQPALLLEAFLRLAPPRAALVFVGDGAEKPALLARAAEAPAGSVHFLPFANQSEMPARHALADTFVLPSRGAYETWGLAVNEAMHMARPCIVSDQVGCHLDLILPGETGWIFPAGDEAALAACLLTALSLPPEELRARGRAAAAHAAAFSYENASAGLVRALHAATGLAP